ncbi:hypothetical protein K432DRAFT_353940 [Lepidopterella palustris CBS 459.81]|uniref:Uncharacterized protein n=1 Tax=Lepidopterella palustris CBS 459.81 TaxID=1314670 RepID=A0A8E2JEW9_9PEZI|nr:hypothetical protein K432DRAFT_353940 [Lepidopterella palustris CBS 459.81]
MDTFRINAVAIIALAELGAIAERTALTGASSYWECLILAPGLHKQQSAADLNKAEYPATAALTSGYVFRVENSATVHYLQRVGKTGHLTSLRVHVSTQESAERNHSWSFRPLGNEQLACLLCLSASFLTVTATAVLLRLRDWWAITVIAMLISCRLLNTVVLRRRGATFWAGASEPNVQGDLLILLSRDRWVRMRGLVDDLKAVTSGEWLRDPTVMESFAINFATLLVYSSVIVSENCSNLGSLVILMLLLASTAILGMSNLLLPKQRMHDRVISVVGEPVKYKRRLDLAKQLIKETGRDDWAVGLGMIVPEMRDTVRATM